MSVKVLCWNCRGLSNGKTISRIKSLLRNHQPDIVCLVETRADEKRTINFCDKFRRMWEWAAIPARGMSGGIITLWKQGVGLVTPIANSRFSLHLVLTTERPKEWILSVVYNAQSVHLQKNLWHDLNSISSLNLPWILMGDFNAILNSEEHRGGCFDHYAAKAKHFTDFISSNQLFDLGFYGTPYTWCNNQSGMARRWARLDRFLANNIWLTNFDSYYNKHLPRTASDHSPMFLIAKLFAHQKKKIFRFENYWFEYQDCHQQVYKAWNYRGNGSPMHTFTHYLSRTRSYLSNWKFKSMSSLDKMITQTEEEIAYLESLETSLNYGDLNNIALRSLYNTHLALLRQNCTRWAQRSRLMWLKHGDYNTSFFHKQARIRGHKNKISCIINEQGDVVTEQQDIGQMFRDFYSRLWSKSNTYSVDELVLRLPNDMAALDDEDIGMLSRPITITEVFHTIKSMPKGKSRALMA
ncbi:hypothetical protein J5N97_024588 [Dioscorea zingiberensis]|uniref:Endonuclease/exonuclease/phosphatase domain-containing protein n=1 Tax=Dioscorea zingiberensis TaxID=325984 RepID=A0A9D5C704_9LILI|nr:hypothetical protein J5N97_024588 [Dioscorea zingiberensis]